MTAVIESGVGHVWQIKQATAGTVEPTASTYKHLRKTGDKAMKAAKKYGSEEWVDGQQFGSPGHYVDQIGGDVGGFVFQVQPETGGFAFAQITGVDSVSGASDPYTHTVSSGTAAPPLQTVRAKTGSSVVWRQAWYDAIVNKLAFNCGQDQKIAHIDQDFMALQAGAWATADPAAADSGTDPFNWAEVVGEIKIDGTSIPELDGETVELDRKWDVHRGDNPAPICFVPGKGEINRTFSGLVTDTTIDIMQSILFGSTTPAANDPVTSVVADVALVSKYTRSASRTLELTTPKVIVNPEDFEVFPRAEGGKIPVAFGGLCVKDGSTAAFTAVAKTGDATSYVA